MNSPHVLAAKPVREVEGIAVVEIDTSAATYFGKPWRELGDYGKRKFETLVMLYNAGAKVKLLYV